MLVLTRKKDERINIGPDIQVVVLEIHGNRVRLGLVAPPQMPILREELRARAEWAKTEKPIEAAARRAERAGGLK
jgi:carbon storage regulator